METIIKVEGLSKSYKKRAALHDVSLEVKPGEIFCLIGPDGAGKSSLLHILAGILRSDSGSASVLGIDVLAAPESVKPHIGLMAQGLGHSLSPDLSVEENIDYFAAIRQVDRAKRDEMKAVLLEATQLTPFTGRAARNLSGGMKQKLALCCTLIHSPELLLLDEPSTGVDPVSRRDLYEVINRLVRDEKVTVMVSTSYMDEAERAHRVALMHEGRVLACDTPDGIKESLAEKESSDRWRRMEAAFRSAIKTETRLSQAVSVNELFRGQEISGLSKERNELDGIVSAEDLSRCFGHFTAVNSVSFRVERGEVFGFLGPNGAGKTTLIKMFCGLLPPSEGSGSVMGIPLRAGRLRISGEIGYMSQKFSLYKDLKVIENLKLFGGIYGLGGRELRRRVDFALELSGLVGREKEPTRALPLGIKQRLALACATMHQPELIFLDEPTSGVDPIARDRFWEIIRELSVRGVTVIVTTHYMDEAERCERLMLMDEGEIAAIGTPSDLKKEVQGQIGSPVAVTCPDYSGALRILRSHYSRVTVYGATALVYTHEPEIESPKIERLLKAEGLDPTFVGPADTPFEEVFIYYVEGKKGEGYAESA